ncbi:MAG: hypothetical protein R3C15_14435 [Thermoleophilia bacterium]
MQTLLALAQAADPQPARSSGGQIAFVVGILAFTWVSLMVVVYVFWRAKRREDARKRKEPTWPSAPSS